MLQIQVLFFTVTWIPWVIAAVTAVVTAALGIKTYHLGRANRDDNRRHQAHTEDMDWLGVARGELAARVDAAKSETLLKVAEVDSKVVRLDLDLQHTLSGISRKLDELHGAMGASQASVNADLAVLRTQQSTLGQQQAAQFERLVGLLGDLYEALGEQRPAVLDLTSPPVPAEARRVDL